MPTAYSTNYCSRADVEAWLSAEGVSLRLDDDQSGTESAAETAYLATQGISYATARVNQFCRRFYSATELAKSWLVNEWASIIAARWLCTRRANPVPDSLQKLFDEALEELKLVRRGTYGVPDIARRNVDIPAWSNVRLDVRYRVRMLRVEKPISEDTPTTYPQNTDVFADFSHEI